MASFIIGLLLFRKWQDFPWSLGHVAGTGGPEAGPVLET
jgi:hypothetical protein